MKRPWNEFLRPVLLVAAACILGSLGLAATAGAHPGHTGPHDELSDLRTQAEALIADLNLDGWNSWSNGDDSHSAEIYGRYPGLFTPENIRKVQDELGHATAARDRKALVLLKRYLEGEFINQKAAAMRDSISNLEIAATVVVDTGRISYYQADNYLANQPDHLLRLKAYRAEDSVLASIDPLRLQVLDLTSREAAALGYKSRLDYFEFQKGVSFANLEAEVRGFLEDTRGVYDSSLTALCASELHLPREQLRRADVGRLNRLQAYDGYFSRQELLPILKKSWAGIGVDVDRQRNILIDSEIREKKNPRAVCFSIHVPTDIRLSVKPQGGLQDYEALFHEMGHAEHYAHTRQDRWEFRDLGTNTFTECMAFLDEYLIEDPAWVGANLKMPEADSKEFLARAGFLRLLLLRRYAGKFLFELALHRGESDWRGAYHREMQAALLYPLDASDDLRALRDDEGFYEGDYLQAWFLEAMLKEKLQQKFGANYFQKPEAGLFLKELWAYGNELDGPDLARRLGEKDTERGPLVRELQRLIRSGGLGAGR